jgi:hypothetical protein
MIAETHPGIHVAAEALAWIRSPIGKVKPIRSVVVTYRQRKGEVGHRDVERCPVIVRSVAKKPH